MSLGLIFLYLLVLRKIIKASDELAILNNELLDSKKQMELALAKLDYSYKETIAAASAAIDARDPYTAGHSKRVSDMATNICYGLNLPAKEIEEIALAALLHDIGKIGISDGVLNKNGKLDSNEFEKIKTHPLIGHNILKNMGFFSSILPLILYHHERPDGLGYPKGLKEGEIPLGAAIIAVADSYDAMTSDRPYRKALSHESAVREIKLKSGIQFDKEIVDAFIKTVSIERRWNYYG